MAVAVTGTPGSVTDDDGGATITLSGYTNPAGGNLMIVVLGIGSSGGGPTTVSGVTFNTTETFTKITLFDATDSTFLEVEAWYLLAPSVTTADVVVTGVFTQHEGIIVQSFSGVDQTTPFGTAVTASGSGTTPSVGVGSASGDLMFYGIMSDAQGGFSGRSGTLIKTSAVIASDTIMETQSMAGTGGTVTGTWTQASTGWVVGGVAIKAAAAGGAAVRVRRQAFLGVG